MKSLVAAVALASVLGACTAQTKQAGLAGGGILTVAGSVLALSGAMSDCSNEGDFGAGLDCNLDSAVSTSFGVVTAAAGIIMLITAAAAPDVDEGPMMVTVPSQPQPAPVYAWDAPAPAAPTTVSVHTSVTVTTGDGTIDPQTIEYTHELPVPAPRTADPMLRNFTQQASMAARAGQCLAVRAIAVRVEDLNPAYRQDGFLRDPLVVACLQ